MSRKRSNLAHYTSIIATIGTAVLAITALITVYITISGWKEEQEANRPYFTFKEAPEVILSDSPEFEIEFTNVGEHPAVSLWSKCVVFSSDLESKPIAVDEYALVNDIPKNASATLLIELDALKEEVQKGKVPPHYIVIALKYEDPIINKSFIQNIYIEWSGMENGKALATNHAEEEERKQINSYFELNDIRF